MSSKSKGLVSVSSIRTQALMVKKVPPHVEGRAEEERPWWWQRLFLYPWSRPRQGDEVTIVQEKRQVILEARLEALASREVAGSGKIYGSKALNLSPTSLMSLNKLKVFTGAKLLATKKVKRALGR